MIRNPQPPHTNSANITWPAFRGPWEVLRVYTAPGADVLPASAIPPADDRMVLQIREGLRDHVALHHRPAPAIVGSVARVRAGDELDAAVRRVNGWHNPGKPWDTDRYRK
jgi:hypothetical protein